MKILLYLTRHTSRHIKITLKTISFYIFISILGFFTSCCLNASALTPKVTDTPVLAQPFSIKLIDRINYTYASYTWENTSTSSIFAPHQIVFLNKLGEVFTVGYHDGPNGLGSYFNITLSTNHSSFVQN